MSSIEKRDENTWRVRFRHRGKHRSITHISEKSALKWKAVLDTSGADTALQMLNQPDLPKITLGEHLENHIENLTGVTDGTRKTYRAMIFRNMGEIKDFPIALLDHAAIAKWVNRLAKVGLSGKTIANVHGLLSSGMNSAVASKIILENPCRGLRLPTTSHQDVEMTYLEPDEFGELFEHIPDHYRPLILTLVGTGMRFGEATALQVGDINIQALSIQIRRAWKMTGYAKKELGAPKTKRSIRTVAMSYPVAEILVPLMQGRASADFLFTNSKGNVIAQQAFHKIWALAVQEYAGDEIRIDRDRQGRKVRVVTKLGQGKHPRIHDLRHTFASWALQDNNPLPVIQRQLGHNSITTTIDRYGHLARADFDAMGSLIAKRLPAPVHSERLSPLELEVKQPE